MICYSKDGIGRYIGKTEQPLYDPDAPKPVKEEEPKKAEYRRMPLLCVETGIEYASAASAAREVYAGNTKYASQRLRKASRSGKEAFGFHWRPIAEVEVA